MFRYLMKGLMGDYDYSYSNKKKNFHWLSFEAFFFWIIEIRELCKWCFRKLKPGKNMRNTRDELNEIFSELHSAPQTFKYAINVYKSLPEDHPEREILADAIRNARADFTRLDVLLEDIQIDIEHKEVKDKQNEKKYTNPGYGSLG